ncbi:hypothetical protein [Streptosporangium sp. NPDC023615]|uniref:hypothetical protein n=1 Tax=Streptosporangium sp. NPDC023615 TaxID=3154794 RepID=UPI00342225DC
MATAAPRVPPTAGTTRGRLSRLNLVMFLPLLTAVGVLLVARDAGTWWQAAVLGLGVVAALVAFVWWAARDLSRIALPCLVVAAAVWALGALVMGTATAFYGISIVGPLIVPRLPRHRGWAALGVTAYVAAVGAARLLVTPEDTFGVLVECGSTCRRNWRTRRTSPRPRASACASTGRPRSTRTRANCSARSCGRRPPTSCGTRRPGRCASP